MFQLPNAKSQPCRPLVSGRVLLIYALLLLAALSFNLQHLRETTESVPTNNTTPKFTK